MSFYMPLGLLGLLGVPVLILIYILKRRYREETVPSTFMWKRSLAYMKKRFPWNLRNSILLLLQILAIVLVSFILARPYVVAKKSNEVIAIIDASASMMSQDETGTTRFARAVKKVEELAEDAGPNSRVTVITAGDTAKQHIYRSDVRADIKRALAECACTYSPPDLEGALRLAESAQEENTQAKIVLYTDTTYETADGIEIIDVTNREWNIAALGLEAQQNGGIWSFKGNVCSYGDDLTVTASLYVDGQYVSVKKVSCTDGVPAEVAFRDYEAVDFTIAQLIVSVEGETDALTADNTYSYYYSAQAKKNIQVAYGPGCYDGFLYSALRVVNDGGVTTAVQVNQLDENGRELRTTVSGIVQDSRIRYSGFDLYVFVGVIPETLPQDGALWFINPPVVTVEDENGTPVQKQIQFPEGISAQLGNSFEASESDRAYSLGLNITDEEPYASVLRGISLQNVAVKKYTSIESDKYVGLVRCNFDTVLAAGQEGHQRVMILTIALSDLPTNMLDYVVLMGNMFAYSCPDVLDDQIYTVGENAVITVPPGASEITVLRDNTPVKVVPADDMEYLFTLPGNYEFQIAVVHTGADNMTEAETETLYCFAAISSEDSNIYSTQDSIGAEPLPDGLVTKLEPTEIWWYFLIALMIVLMAEWWVYYRV